MLRNSTKAWLRSWCVIKNRDVRIQRVKEKNHVSV